MFGHHNLLYGLVQTRYVIQNFTLLFLYARNVEWYGNGKKLLYDLLSYGIFLWVLSWGSELIPCGFFLNWGL